MIIIPFGVSGCGKTTVANALAQTLGWMAYDADDFHSEANKSKMKAGDALTDEDRRWWFAELAMLIANAELNNSNITLACSALKVKYRQYLRAYGPVKFVLLEVNKEAVKARFEQRNAERIARGEPPHFMSPKLIDSQFSTLETTAEVDLVLDAELPVEALVEQIIVAFGLNAFG